MEPPPPEVLSRIAATVREVVDVPELAGFGIGRSNLPTPAGHALGADAVVEVYRADDDEEAGFVELHLTERFASDAKYRALGPIRSDGRRVFVALWAIEDIPAP